MKILGASLTELVEQFMHVGYGSAYPRPIHWYVGDAMREEPSIRLDAVEATQLVEQSASWMDVEFAFLGLGVGMVAAAPRHLRAPAAGLLTACALLVAAPPVQADTDAREFVHPDLATVVLAHGIVADALSASHEEVTDLAELGPRIALPVSEPSEGLTYAASHWWLDGWGRPFELSKEFEPPYGPNSPYLVRSAGADGELHTGDDLVARIPHCDKYSWDEGRHAWWVRAHEGQTVLLTRTFDQNHIPSAPEAARALTGNDGYDLSTTARWDEEETSVPTRILSIFQDGRDWDPLILTVHAWEPMAR